MMITEWNLEEAKEVWIDEAEERGEIRGEAKSDKKWQSIIADKDAALADKDAALAKQKAENERLLALLATKK